MVFTICAPCTVRCMCAETVQFWALGLLGVLMSEATNQAVNSQVIVTGCPEYPHEQGHHGQPGGGTSLGILSWILCLVSTWFYFEFFVFCFLFFFPKAPSNQSRFLSILDKSLVPQFPYL